LAKKTSQTSWNHYRFGPGGPGPGKRLKIFDIGKNFPGWAYPGAGPLPRRPAKGGCPLGEILRQKFFCVKKIFRVFEGRRFLFFGKSGKISRGFVKRGQGFSLSGR
jgi:hypothetical protein